MQCTFENEELTLSGTILISDWNGQEALASINQACEIKHTGADGVNKIWDEVAISVKTTLKKECK